MPLVRTGAIAVLLAAAIVACGGHDGGTGPSVPTVSALSVSSPSAPIVSYEDTVRLVATPRSANGTPVPDAAITWTSSDANIASVASTGTVTAHHNGTATVTATAGSVSAQATVTVQQVPVKLAFVVQPGETRANAALSIAPQVQLQDAGGHRIENATVQITIAPTTAATGSLGGTTTVTAYYGVATFPGLTPSRASTGTTLTATVAGGASVQAATSAPFDVALDVVQISAGGVTTCARTTDGTAYCWGENSTGRVGDGTTTTRVAPVRVAGGLKFTSLQAGDPLTCGLVQGGSLYCWGTTDPANNVDSPSPVLMGAPVPFSTIAIGWHGCGLDATGVPYCWGASPSAIGAGVWSTTPLSTPTLAMGGNAFRSITTGISFTCGVLRSVGPWCAGDNSRGQLGTGNTDATNTLERVVGNLDLTVVAAGDKFACGLTSGGSAWCWGDASDGDLGNGTTSGFSSVPVPVSGVMTYTAIEAGGRTACGLTSVGMAYCWGRGIEGQLGSGQYQSSATPVAVTGHRFTSISVGGFHVCGIATDGFTYCWGNNTNGAIGTGGYAWSNVPVRISPPTS